MEATRHPFDAWLTDDLGESVSKTFKPDVSEHPHHFASGSSSRVTAGLDSAVRTQPTLYFRRELDTSDEHDEWTIDGKRYKQDGEAAVWRDPKTNTHRATVVTLERRAG